MPDLDAVLSWNGFVRVLQVPSPRPSRLYIPLSVFVAEVAEEPLPFTFSIDEGWVFEYRGTRPDGTLVYESREAPWETQIRNAIHYMQARMAAHREEEHDNEEGA